MIPRRWAILLISPLFPYPHPCPCASSFPAQPGWIILINEQVLPKLIIISAIVSVSSLTFLRHSDVICFVVVLDYGFFLCLSFFGEWGGGQFPKPNLSVKD